jgi:hypothetical protein
MIGLALRITLLTVLLSGQPYFAASPLTGFPFAEEDLTYTIGWPSGLSLGETRLHAKHSGANWNFELTVDAGVPGFQVKDLFHSESTADFCTVSFDRNTSQGTRKTLETETVGGGMLTRRTLNGGGESTLAVPDCVKDALTYLYFARRELGQGRVPAAQQILFGGLYRARLDYAGAQTIEIGNKPVESDKVVCAIQGVASDFKFEMYFARDPARTPLLVKVPLAMGTFSMELVR